jgi:hypothetical protein
VEVPESYLRKFPYLVFPDNVAIALGVAEAVGVDKETTINFVLRFLASFAKNFV